MAKNKRIAFYGGTFDPVHNGHLAIAKKLLKLFGLDEFVYIPAFHAPHKKQKPASSAYHRYAMLCLGTNSEPLIKVSTVELDATDKAFTIETQGKIGAEFPNDTIFFVIGADSWRDITTWREWERVLTVTNIIVVTRPDYEIAFDHVTEEIRSRIVDLRGTDSAEIETSAETRIYITDVVNKDVSASEIRALIAQNSADWKKYVPAEVEKYIEKYELYIRSNTND